MTDHSITSLIEKLEGAEVSAIQRLDPNDVLADDHAPFKGRDRGLFQIAPGWKRLELNRVGLTVRSAILRAQSEARV
jgi:hypothetical protein